MGKRKQHPSNNCPSSSDGQRQVLFSDECRFVIENLSNLHGHPQRGDTTMPLLDSLVRTILSQNTTDKNSRRAFTSLKEAFPTWKCVLEADSSAVEESIRMGGLAAIKTARIKSILESLITSHKAECLNGEPSMEWMRSLSTSEIKAELAKYKGIGPKTISCVLLFNLDRAEFPVDTHVWHIAKKLGWVSSSCTRDECYFNLNERIPDDCKYALHVLLVEHGKRCRKCAKGPLQSPEEGVCPLSNWDAAKSRASSPHPSPVQSTAPSSRVARSDKILHSGCDLEAPHTTSSTSLYTPAEAPEVVVKAEHAEVGNSEPAHVVQGQGLREEVEENTYLVKTSGKRAKVAVKIEGEGEGAGPRQLHMEGLAECKENDEQAPAATQIGMNSALNKDRGEDGVGGGVGRGTRRSVRVLRHWDMQNGGPSPAECKD